MKSVSVPRVSVVMGVYNGASYVQEAIDSILNQTFSDFQFLIIDDASVDQTAHILSACTDPRVQVYRNEENLGLARTLNRGVRLAQGEYIARQDADDLSYPERLAEEIAFLDAHPDVGVVATITEWKYDVEDRLQVWKQPTDNAGIQEKLVEYCCLIHGSTMYRRQAFEDVDGYDIGMRTGQDYDLWLRMSELWDVACLPQPLYQWRQHGNMASVERKAEQARNAETALQRALERRKGYGRKVLAFGPQTIPPRLKAMRRRKLALRYTWWSAGVRIRNRRVALDYLLLALLLDPTTPEIWSYLWGILARKLHLKPG